MTIPLWMLLAFAAWTAILLAATIGVYRLSRVFTGRAAMNAFPADGAEGDDWYKRSMRAHANCVENLPLFTVVVLALQASGTGGAAVDCLSVAVMAARVLQSLVHVSVPQTSTVVSFRFGFFMVQHLGFLALMAMIAVHAWPVR